MSTSYAVAYDGHGLGENTMSLKRSPVLGGPGHNKRYGVFVETDPDADPADMRRGAAKSWHWGQSWKHFVTETFNNNPKHATQPPLPMLPAAIGQASMGDVGSRKASLTRSNAVHRPRSRNTSSILGIPSQAERPPYPRDPDSPASMTSGESNADTPIDSPLSQSGDHFEARRPSWEFDEPYLQPEADDLKPLPAVSHEPGDAVDMTGRMASPVQAGTGTAWPDAFDETNRITKTGIETVTLTADSSVEELLARIRTLEAELREKNNNLARKDALVDEMLDSLRPMDETGGSDEPLAMAARVGSRMNEANSFLQSIDGALTQRNILMLKYVQRQGDIAAPASAVASEPESSHAAPTVLNIPPFADLDSAMSLAQATEQTVSQLNEFFSATGVTTCCAKAVCKKCHIAGLVAGAAADWWHNLGPERQPLDGSLDWLRCPMPSCSRPLGQQQLQQLQLPPSSTPSSSGRGVCATSSAQASEKPTWRPGSSLSTRKTAAAPR
ncbi:hypothetical protein MAPG_05788 [Magnaporthiopsis poae ATCC 64411]|uniref:Uncharacterized protein n=1 Tax=Magnaporthiopsis poae (strain ATCC 64411 / 73-15) TaxID=644358 RepID=A0A0C4E0B8_MAGP6|nr:hypothetical protein MAPG_05788 [Magnaporthiopsis poae ATCC 64411]